MTCGVRWGNGRFANRPYGKRGGNGFVHAWENGRGCGTGDHEGRPYGERVCASVTGRGGEGVPGGEIPRGRNDMWGALGERAVREPPLRGGGEGTGNGEGDRMGPRIREDTRGREYPAARFLEGLGMTCGVRWGNGRFANRPYGRRGGEGFAHAWENGRGWGTGDHEGRPYGERGGRDGFAACAGK